MTIYNLYSDGNYFPRAKKSGFGGYIEDAHGNSIVEYTEQIRIPQYAHSFELLGIIRGLTLAKSMGITHLHSHCDDKNTVTRLQEVFSLGDTSPIPPHAKRELYQEILDLSKEFTTISFNYIPRNQNKHSDALSRRYSLLMEKNFLRQFTDDLNTAEEALQQGIDSDKKIFFSHPSLIRVQYKNNPFLVAQLRNKKVRRISRTEEKENYDFLFVEVLRGEHDTTYNGFYYDQNKKERVLLKSQTTLEVGENLNQFCEFFSDCTNQIKNKGANKLWVYSNSRPINLYFEQKNKIPNKSLKDFQKVFESLNGLEKVYFHSLPFEHTFSPEIELIEKEKKKLGDSIDNLETLMEQMQNGGLSKDKDKKKYFGLLVRHHLRNYKTLLERDLNNIEKQEIIQKTSDDLVAQGFMDFPEMKKMKM
jgi:ribonuclease HI